MHRYRIYVLIVLFVALFHSLHSTAVSKSSFVNNDKSKLNILVAMCHLGKSHFELFKPLFEELARRGHYVTVLSHFPRSEDAKIKEALPTYKDISLLDSKIGTFINVVDMPARLPTVLRVPYDLSTLREMADVACFIALNNPVVGELLRSNKTFDIILTENFNTDCFLSLVFKYKTPYISLASFLTAWSNDNIGNVDNPSYIPMINLGLARPLKYIDRITNTLSLLVGKIAYHYWFRPKDQAIVDEVFGPGILNLNEIAKKSSAILITTHSSLQGNKPHLSNVVEVGGIHIPDKPNPLPKDIVNFLDSASEGVLYFNFGSMIKMTTMSQGKLDVILKVLASLPRKVIFKWEEDILPRRMNNVMTRKWLPQFDILSKQ